MPSFVPRLFGGGGGGGGGALGTRLEPSITHSSFQGVIRGLPKA